MTVNLSGGDTGRQKDIITPKLHLVAWEITRSCNLLCAHCRASAVNEPYPGELSTKECFHLVDEILEVGKPIIILTGGEPLMRLDSLEIASYAVDKGLRVVMGSNGTLVTKEIAARLKDTSLSRIGISLDFPVPQLQDDFRGTAGAFEAAVAGITNAREAGIDVQINSTITKLNVTFLNELLTLALKLKAVAFHPFMLVPTGRGKELESIEMSPEQHEETLNWIYDKQEELGDRMFFKPTDAPHYLRILSQRQKRNGNAPTAKKPEPTAGHHPMQSITRGCLAGTGFCFISHRGRVQGCGYLDVDAGNIRQVSFRQVWNDSPVFRNIRDLSLVKGKCGFCEYKEICGGCRARAYETTGNYLEAEPYCVYQPLTP